MSQAGSAGKSLGHASGLEGAHCGNFPFAAKSRAGAKG